MKIKLEKKHYQWGLTAFIVAVCSILAFFAIYRFDVVESGFSVCINVLAPFIYGLVMAYLMCPIYNFSVSSAYSLFNRGRYKFRHDLTASKIIGTVISLAIIVIVITGVLWMIIPGLVDSIIKVVGILPSGLQKFTEWVDVKFANLPVAKENLDEWSKDFTAYAVDYATTTILPKSGSVAAAVSGTLIEALAAMMDFIIGIIVCVYFLNIKDTLSAQAKKLIVACCRESTAEEILEGAEYTNKTFGGFISGKIIDSAIIGIICFIVMSIFGWEYSLLISCMIGITNIIPFFGPFIGAIPSVLLLLMVNPTHSLYFIIFVILLQQFDGNILGPKILGDSTGLASFWVLFAVLVGGGLFGFVGMILSIPVFAVIYAYCRRALNKRLAKKGFSTDTLDYKVDKYRTRKPHKGRSKRKPPELNDSKEEPAEEQAKPDMYDEPEVKEMTEEEVVQAKQEGHRIMEATLVEFGEEDSNQE